jgi:site-specific recombinase XerD
MIQHVIQQCAARGQVPTSATPHSLRHTFATRYLLRHPGDLVGLARLLGHTSIHTTQIYVQPTEEEIALRVSQIDLNAYAR